MGFEQSGEGRDDPPDPVAAKREPSRHAYETIGLRASAERLGEQRSEISEISRDDCPALHAST
jgi:hypothetical protein